MAAFNFPNSPSTNDTYTANGVTFKWNGTIWQRISASTGAQGSTGPSGPTGAQGAAAGLTISTSAPGSPSAGDMWWDSDSGLFLTYYNDGNSSQWVELNQGPKGAQGATGAQGAAGAQGATGPTGAQGAAGAQGATGAAGSNASISSNADNRVITGGSGTNLVGEENLTFSGSTLKVNSTTGHSYLKLNSNDSYSGTIHFGDQSDDDAAQIWYDNYQGNGMYLRTSENTPISFYTNNTARLRLTNGGDLTFLNSNADATAGLNSIIFSNNSGEVSRIRGESRNGNTNGMLTFFTDISGSSAERMRVNHDGAFCFGSDSARPAEFSRPSGFSVRWDAKGQFQSTVSGETCGLLNREGSDGGILSFRRGGTGVGEIGVNASTMYLNFGGTIAADHQLDDYEEGEYTANVRVTSGSATFTNQGGSGNKLFYTKIGDIVYVNGGLNASSVSSAGGDIKFNLPFATKNSTAGVAKSVCGAIWNYYGSSNPYGNYGWYPLHAEGMNANVTNNITLYILGYNGSNSNWGPIGNLIGNNSQVHFSFTYRTN